MPRSVTRTNDGLRIDGAQLRCRVVGEGANLGFTQKGRIEYAHSGGGSTPMPSTACGDQLLPTTR